MNTNIKKGVTTKDIEERLQWLKDNFPGLEDMYKFCSDCDNGTYEEVSFSPLGAFLTVARGLAIELDKRYKNNIRTCSKLIMHDQLTGKPVVIKKFFYSTKEWNIVINNFPVFRDIIDYIVSQKVLGKLSKMVWNGKPTITSQ